jgi:hypothetical protein
MDSKEFRSWKWIGMVVVLVATVIGIALPMIYDFARERYERLFLLQERTAIMSVKNNLLLNGFSPIPASELAFGETRQDEIWFVGHIYPQNGISYKNKPTFPNQERPLEYLVPLINQATPGRVFFGGDTIWSPTQEALDSLETLKTSLPMARFILGNHEKYHQVPKSLRSPFAKIFGEPYGYEDFHGVRLVYLHTVTQAGNYGIDAEQRRFLADTLTGENYKYGLLFLHHALWAGHTIYTNTPYANADALASDWGQTILPMLKNGRVKAVFAGDGGWRAPGRQFLIQNIPHYITGWPGGRVDILPEWLTITLKEDEITVIWNRLFKGEQYIRKVAHNAHF